MSFRRAKVQSLECYLLLLQENCRPSYTILSVIISIRIDYNNTYTFRVSKRHWIYAMQWLALMGNETFLF